PGPGHGRRRAVGVRARYPAGRRPDHRGCRPLHRPRRRAFRRPRPPAVSDTASPVPARPEPARRLVAAERRCCVAQEELLRQLYDYTLVGNAPEVLLLTREGLGMGMGPETLLYEALIPSLEEVGARFERGDFFVPEILIACKAMAGALQILRPLLAETGAEPIGTIVMGTVK